MSNSHDSFERLVSSEILPEDVDQEAELLKLEGITPHRGIIAKRLLNEVPDLLFSHWIPSSAKIPDNNIQPMSTIDYEKLVLFLYSTPIPRAIIENFLENPEDENALTILITALKEEGIITKKQWNNTLPKTKSIRVLLLDYISLHKKVAYIDLLQYISSIHISKRPTEAVRISLKRLIQSKQIKDINGEYSIVRD
ncbi:hypothetical protein LCGC14_2206470 [marine sediment metagenome]|uniref:Uncharacterized protein n=1 Tax=marine sediment metagenome TaxID=412755 RepID=A0A0F9E2J2_9ZZZZ